VPRTRLGNAEHALLGVRWSKRSRRPRWAIPPGAAGCPSSRWPSAPGQSGALSRRLERPGNGIARLNAGPGRTTALTA
jgi:hypothetical protein